MGHCRIWQEPSCRRECPGWMWRRLHRQAVLRLDEDVPVLDKTFNDEVSVRRFVHNCCLQQVPC